MSAGNSRKTAQDILRYASFVAKIAYCPSNRTIVELHRLTPLSQQCVLLKEVLVEQIKMLTDRGVMDFLSGMAQGTDHWCSEIVLDLQKKNSVPKLHCILPCKGQESKWTASAQERYRSILAQANEVIYVGQEYNRDCILKRNRYLVDHSSILLAVYNGTWRSGTGATVRYAQQLNCEIIMIDPAGPFRYNSNIPFMEERI